MPQSKIPLKIAMAQLPITDDITKNATKVKTAMRQAAESRVRLIQFPEGMLTGYAKNPIQDWTEVDWPLAHAELANIMVLAKELNIWVVLGSAHQLTPPQWPHNSLYLISDKGELVSRYDKRILSHTEAAKFYTAGSEPVIFDVDGYRFGCIICVEINFPELFAEYGRLGVDCVLLSAYPEAEIFYLKARAHAAINCYWVALSIPTNRAKMMDSGLIGPDGETVKSMHAEEGIVFAEIDHDNPQFDVPLTKARPWRASIATNLAYNTRALLDPRSVNRTAL